MGDYVATYITLVYLNILDIILTIFHLENGGSELNPLVARLITDFGVYWGLIGIKFVFLISLGIYLVITIKNNIQTKYNRLITAITVAYAILILYSVIILG